MNLYIDHHDERLGPFSVAWVPRVGEIVWYPWRRPAGMHESEIRHGEVESVRHDIDHSGQSCVVALRVPEP